MRHALAILKYVPAVLCGLLVALWIASVPYGFSGALMGCGIGCERGSIGLFRVPQPVAPDGFHFHPSSLADFVAWRGFLRIEGSIGGSFILFLPISVLVTALLPLVTMSVMRFPLWSYFAWTALIAAELAYYLR